MIRWLTRVWLKQRKSEEKGMGRWIGKGKERKIPYLQ